ncbi:TolC family protein [candidate division KSB1 bacterium]|nr:TolC family protein [candidate division KSB1 bacterium]
MRRCFYGVLILIILFSTQFGFGQEILTLEQCIEISLKNNSQLKNAEWTQKIAQSGVKASYAGILPSLNARASGGKYHQGDVENLRDIPVEYSIDTLGTPVFDLEGKNLIGWGAQIGAPTKYEQRLVIQPEFDRDSYSFSLDLNQNIFDGGRWWNRIRQAKAEYRAALHTHESSRQLVIRTVKEAYYNLLKQLNLKKVYEEALNSSEEQHKRTESMYEIGSVAKADVLKAKVSVGEARSYLINQNNIVIAARYELNFVMGRDPKTPVQIQESEIVLQAIELSDAELEQAIVNNPVMQSLEEGLNSAEFGLKMAKGSFWPSFGIGGTYSRFNPEASRIYKSLDKNYYWQFGASVQFNIFNGFQDKANLEIKQKESFIAKENYLEQKRQLKSDVTNAYLELKALKEITEINKENLGSAEEDLRMAQERYRVGAGTLLDILDAQVSVTTARGTLVRAKYDAVIAKAKLEYYMGILEN